MLSALDQNYITLEQLFASGEEIYEFPSESPSGAKLGLDQAARLFNFLCLKVGIGKLNRFTYLVDRANRAKQPDAAACREARSELYRFWQTWTRSQDDFNLLMAHFCPFGIESDSKWNTHDSIWTACKAIDESSK